MALYRVKRSKKSGLPPGSLVHVGEKKSEQVHITVVRYNEEELESREVAGLDDCLRSKGLDGVTWINIDGLHDVRLIEQLGAHYGIHPLTLEDCLNTGQRPKLDEFDDYIYVVLRMFGAKGTVAPEGEQISLILGRGFVISLQEYRGDVFNAVRERLTKKQGKIRRVGADYLFYALIDSIVDSYAVVIEEVAERIEALDTQVFERQSETTLDGIHRLKKQLLNLRRSIGPLREVTKTLERDESDLVESAVQVYLEDVHDHVVAAVEQLDVYREMLKGILDTYLSLLTQRTNEVMKVLTVLAAIFIPLTFIAGVYGMNFHHMPELRWRYGYPAALTGMVLIAVSLLYYFRRRNWL
ncbi:MAG: magnesium/cobalt transporter CorA [Bdellovibrionales bacterium]|nr:magnesium/cobalt transporter CorA [Bdellovibrionales bacterium]